jgi:hypothetical protein
MNTTSANSMMNSNTVANNGDSLFLESRMLMRNTKANGFDNIRRPISYENKVKVLTSNNDSQIQELLPNVQKQINTL